jgi:hypothetical protein
VAYAIRASGSGDHEDLARTVDRGARVSISPLREDRERLERRLQLQQDQR